MFPRSIAERSVDGDRVEAPVDLAEHALACREHPNSHTRDGKTHPAATRKSLDPAIPPPSTAAELGISRRQATAVVVCNTLCSKVIQGFVARESRPAVTGIDQKANPGETSPPPSRCESLMTPTPKVEIIAGKIRVVCYGVLVGEPPKAKPTRTLRRRESAEGIALCERGV
jgi:hypothetical protein